jgi:hypothetical protein
MFCVTTGEPNMNFTRRAAFSVIAGLLGGVVSQASAMDMASELEAEGAITGARGVVPRIGRIARVPSVGVVNLNLATEQFNRDERVFMVASDFRGLAARNAAGVSRMRRALIANPATRSALADHGIEVRYIVGVRVSSNGSLRLFVLR